MVPRVEITEDVDVPVGRGLIAYKAGWKGPVKAEVHEKLMKTGKALDKTPKSKDEKTKADKTSDDKANG
mgnify:CR=1 FL=1|tara:strand:+ start:11914 stop:12120 length:207 start_codon:yes stop_codon:yes gene_type:complete